MWRLSGGLVPRAPRIRVTSLCEPGGLWGRRQATLLRRGKDGRRAASKGRDARYERRGTCRRGELKGGFRTEQEARSERGMDAAAGTAGGVGDRPHGGVRGDHPPWFAADNMVPLRSVTGGLFTSNTASQRNHNVIGGDARCVFTAPR